jgi:hypothetical protein
MPSGAASEVRAEQSGNTHAEDIRKGRQHQRRRRGQAVLDLAKKANRQIGTGGDRLQRHGTLFA